MILIFILGYIAIIAEHLFKINKSAFALLTGVLCWTFYASSAGGEHAVHELEHHISDIAGILLFLMGAMTIVEIIDQHDGFSLITDRIKSTNAVKLLWIIAFITFFMSAVLDNLTTAIVMVTLSRKLIHSLEHRKFMAGIIIIAANAGGAFSPIGDVTTTMLWLGGQISAISIITNLFIPSLVCIIVPLIYISFQLKGKEFKPQDKNKNAASAKGRGLILCTGLLALISVPVFKVITHLPPYMGVLLGLGMLWLITELLHKNNKEGHKFSAAHALSKIDMPSILFFFGILASVASLQSAGYLQQLSLALDKNIGNKDIIVSIIGLASAVIDNVPLVAASMGMYNLHQFPMDHKIWEFMAYAAGTGGSILIIGSAAGVAVMGIEKIDFMWYLKKISLIAMLGYFAGLLTYLGIFALIH